MFTVSVSLFLDVEGEDVNPKRAIADFTEYVSKGGHNVINTKHDMGNDGTDQVTFRIASKEPHVLFKEIETWANQGEDIPECLQNFFFEETVYHIIAIPEEVSVVELVEIINFTMNAACVNRTQCARLRNMYLADREGEVLMKNSEIRAFNERNAVHQAINILSQKLMGTDILKIINQKEEVTWPVH